MKIYNILDIPV